MKNNEAFAKAHPEIAAEYAEEGLDWLNVYTKLGGELLLEKWERNESGELVDVTAIEKAKREVLAAEKALNGVKHGAK